MNFNNITGVVLEGCHKKVFLKNAKSGIMIMHHNSRLVRNPLFQNHRIKVGI